MYQGKKVALAKMLSAAQFFGFYHCRDAGHFLLFMNDAAPRANGYVVQCTANQYS